MSRKDNNLPFESQAGQDLLKERLSHFKQADTVSAFWEFHEYLKSSGIASKIDVRTQDDKRNGTTVYHDKLTMMWVNIWLVPQPWVEIVLYTGLNNQSNFPGLTSCWFRKNNSGGQKLALDKASLAKCKKYVQESAAIMDAEAVKKASSKSK